MDNVFHQPQGGNEMPRFGGRATMMRLPFIEDLQGLDAAFVGIPLDIGTSQRSGTRYGPRYIRTESVMIRPYNMATGAAPFDSLSVADIGDVPINTYNLLKSVQIIEDYYTGLNSFPLIPLTLGGDHTITLPILRALAYLNDAFKIQQPLFDGAAEGGAVGNLFAEHLIVGIGVGVDVNQTYRTVLFG